MRQGRCKLKIGGDAQCRVPAVSDILDAKFLGHPGNSPLFGNAANLRGIGLNDIECAALQPWRKALAAGEYFATGYGHGTLATELTEIIDGIGLQGFLEPAHIMGGKHMRCIDGPAQAVGPVGIAAACIHEQLAACTNTFAGCLDDGLVQLPVIAAAKGSPAYLEGAKTLGAITRKCIAHHIWFLHQEGAVGLYALAVSAAQQASHRLSQCLAQDIPQGDIDAADGVGEGAATAHPEGVLVQFLAYPLRFESILAGIKRLQNFKGCFYQSAIGENAAIAGNSGVSVDCDKCVDGVFGLDLGRPAALGRFSQ